jgi:hypothetical protein
MPKPQIEVEDILRDIRRRVFDDNGVKDESSLQLAVERIQETDASDVRINTYLETTDRLRRSLPPIRSDRRGLPAKIEIWIKARIERAMRWFVFDQVNFNSAVHQILRELREVEVRQQKTLVALTELQSSIKDEVDRQGQEQRLINEEQRAFNEETRIAIEDNLRIASENMRMAYDEMRIVNEEQRALNQELITSNEELRLQLKESEVTIDRMRRNFEHRLTQIEERGS